MSAISFDPATRDVGEAARDCFSPDYFAARDRFVELAEGVESLPIEAVGPAGEPLFTDAAWIGPEDALHVVVVLSATHGVEGYCGSGIQIDWLSSGGAARLGPGQAMLLIHAVNAYGFAWDRRVTEEGCDLNRNCVDFSHGAPENRAYADIAPFLVPASLDEKTLAEAEAEIALYRETHGDWAYQIAAKGGQYVDPHGMFFGGDGPSAARLRLERLAERFGLAQREFVTIIDVHTGLGPFGYGEPQNEAPPDRVSHRLAFEIFGPSVTSPDLGTSTAVPVTGTLQELWERLIGDGRHVYICLEYGTFDQERSRAAYRLDHWFHRYGGGDPVSETGREVRRTMRDQFCSDRQDWREMVLFRGRQIIGQALAGTRGA